MNILTAEVYQTLKLHRQLMRETLDEIRELRKDVKPTAQAQLRKLEYMGKLPSYKIMD